MDIVNALRPDAEQIAALQASDDPGPVVMVNLLRFKDKAVYADGRETDWTGLQAFQEYSRQMKTLVEGHGGKFIVSAILDKLVMGGGEMPWHRIGLVQYPSRAVFLKVMADPSVHEAAQHRHAGLEGQWLISSTLEIDHRA